MKRTLRAALCASLLGLAVPAIQAATNAEIREKQALGRVLVSPDGQFFIYEWMRPYSWDPNPGKLAPAAASRMQAWLYRVDTNLSPTTSQYLFSPGSGATYYLGALSPDEKKVSFYELNRNGNTVKAGVALLDGPLTPKLTWFEPAPDDAHLDQTPVWLSNEEIVYPAKSGSKFVRGNAGTGEAKACEECDGAFHTAPVPVPASLKMRSPSKEVPKDAKLLAQSPNGDLAVYSASTPQLLILLFTKGDGAPQILFENERRPQSYGPPKSN